MRSAFTDELRMSVHKFEESHKKKSQGQFGFLGSPMKSPFRGRRPTLTKEQQDELRASARNLMSKREQNDPDGGRVKPVDKSEGSDAGLRQSLMSKAMAEELRASFHKREASNQSRREEIRTRMMQRKQSKGQIYPDSIREEQDSETDSEDRPPRRAQISAIADESGDRPRLRPELFDELRKSIHGRSTRNFDRRQQIKERIMKRRESQRVLPLASSAHSIDSSEPSFAESEDIPLKAAPKSGKKGKGKKMTWDTSQHSVDTFLDESFSDRKGSSHGHGFESSTSRDLVQPSPIFDSDNAVDPPEDFDSLRLEWSTLVRENKKLKNNATVDEKKISILARQVYDLKAEGTDLRKQLSNWQDKVSAISKRQSQDRIKFENSTDLIAKARVELTKTLNENSALKTTVHELELAADDRQRRIQSLNENVASQSGRITLMSAELRDIQTELRYNIDEKRRLEEELAVIVASRDGKDIGETIRRLEQDRAQWLEEKERTLEAKRIALDEENDRVLEREKKRYREEAEELMEISEKTRDRELEHQRLQEIINKQLTEMKEANEDLRDKLQQEHMENRVETKKKDHTIAMLEQEVSKLRRKLAASQLREQEYEARLAEIENNDDELRHTKKQNSLLEKQIRKLRKGKPIQQGGGDWKEIVLPGYKNLHGVTFGAPSEDLAGFLTILVEDQRSKQSETKSKLQKEVRKYLRELRGKAGESDKKGSTKRKSKTVKKKSTTTKKKKISTKLRSSKKKKPTPSKQPKRQSSFTDIEDYDWDVKPKKIKKKKSKRTRSVEEFSDDDSVAQRRSKRHKKLTKKTKRKSKKKLDVKKKASKKKSSKHGEKHQAKKSGGRRISRHAARKDDSEMMADLKDRNPEDVSLAVMKQAHTKKRSSGPRLRLPPVVPPESIVLQ